ncbi:EAL domain-containing protein [Vibrio metschnikovii]|uniref:EAL domain-containing protein n=1 Tax=Vibrio metschnikovii TaxID=28172 RepID=UPI001C302EB7|nr:EAL domain-containing protein [Vibrio metschnikovii]
MTSCSDPVFRVSCAHCQSHDGLDFSFTMAFQPIIDVKNRMIFGYEALVRGEQEQSAYSIISQINEHNRYLFDQTCRVKAIQLASQLGLDSMLSINFLPNAIYQPERCLRTTIEAAQRYDFPISRILFEFTEVEKFEDTTHVKRVVEYYKSLGFLTAIDDFGSGYSGLNLLADFQTNIVKLDMQLIRGIDVDLTRQSIVRNCLTMFKDLNITPLAEGVETLAELGCLMTLGVPLIQGYVFAEPGFECLPKPDIDHILNTLPT